ncbi:MAG: pilin [Patescibacteria group bacterium]
MKKYLFIFLSFFIFLSPVLVLAQDNNTDSNPAPCAAGNGACIDNPIGANSFQALIGKIITAVLGVVGSLALVMFIFGGITWMTSGGSPDKIKKGRDIVVWAVIGLVIIFSSYALVRFLLGSVT